MVAVSLPESSNQVGKKEGQKLPKEATIQGEAFLSIMLDRIARQCKAGMLEELATVLTRYRMQRGSQHRRAEASVSREIKGMEAAAAEVASLSKGIYQTK